MDRLHRSACVRRWSVERHLPGNFKRDFSICWRVPKWSQKLHDRFQTWLSRVLSVIYRWIVQQISLQYPETQMLHSYNKTLFNLESNERASAKQQNFRKYVPRVVSTDPRLPSHFSDTFSIGTISSKRAHTSTPYTQKHFSPARKINPISLDEGLSLAQPRVAPVYQAVTPCQLCTTANTHHTIRAIRTIRKNH